jgi:hypothetical protein
MDWLVYFPNSGNGGKYLSYEVLFRERKGGSSRPAKRATLGEVLESREFEQHYPHTVGFFKGSIEEEVNSGISYLEIRIIKTVEEFWVFLNALDI